MKLVFDIEADGLLDDGTKIHSLVAMDVESSKLYSYADQDGYPSIKEGISFLEKADMLIGHNIILYDIPYIQKLYAFQYKNVFDTLTASRLIYTNMFDMDMKASCKGILLKNKLAGRHSLKAWGVRLKAYKGSFGEGTDWKEWSKEMQDYCEQDVKVQEKLYQHILSKNYSKEALNLEFRFQEIIGKQERNGIYFDTAKASKLYYELKTEQEELKKKIQETIKPIERTILVPKVNNKTLGYIKGVPVDKTKPFNPNSHQQIAKFFMQKYNWEPTEFTKSGLPSTESDVLASLPWKEVPDIIKYLDITKVKGRLMNEKEEGWLTQHKNGKIHGQVLTNGAITGRCTHRIISNIPRVTSYKGLECRSLFHSGPYSLVGCDASQLELRMLAHYMAAYDNGAYAREVDEGDIHTANQLAAGLDSRDNAKTFIYGLNYGAGNAKIGSIVCPEASTMEKEERGKKLRESFMQLTPAYEVLVKAVQGAAKRGYLKGLDGREIVVRENYRALNTLLQCAGAVIMKKATCIMWDLFEEHKIQAEQAINYHDENQVIAISDPNEIGKLMVKSIELAGEYYKLRCPLRAEYKIGKTWADTH